MINEQKPCPNEPHTHFDIILKEAETMAIIEFLRERASKNQGFGVKLYLDKECTKEVDQHHGSSDAFKSIFLQVFKDLKEAMEVAEQEEVKH